MKKFLPLLAILLLSAALLVPLSANPNSNQQEAARLNNIGVAYMNQQLFQKALTSFEQAASADSKLEVAVVNRGVALLNLQRVDDAKTRGEQDRQRDKDDLDSMGTEE